MGTMKNLSSLSVSWWVVATLGVAIGPGCGDDALKILGATCARDDQCTTGRCDELVCKSGTPLGAGERCTNPFECASENCAVIADEARCGPGTREPGEPCTNALQCASALCVADVCAEEGSDGGVGVDSDVPADGGVDDAPSDASVDAGVDTLPDTAADATADATVDAAAPPPQYLWHKNFGSSANDYGWWMGVDRNDNVYFVAGFRNTIDPGGGDVTSKGEQDFVVVSYTADGTHRWQKALGGPLGDYGLVLVLDGNDNVYVAGSFAGTADFGGGDATALGTRDVFLTSFTSGGTHRWQKTLGGSGALSSCYGMVLGGNDSVFLTGVFAGTADLGDGAVSSAGGSRDAYVTSFDAAGVHRWKKIFGGSESDTAYGVAVDGDGNVTLTGEYDGTSDFGGGSVTSKGRSDVFVVSVDSAGAYRWQKTLGGTYFDAANAIAADSGGNVYVAGYFGETADLGGGEVIGKGEIDLFISSFSAAGAHRWQRALGGLGYDYPDAVAVDSHDNIYVTGRFDGLPDLGGGSVGSQGGEDVFVTSFTRAGIHRWQKGYGGIGNDEGHHVMLDNHDNLYLSGYFSYAGADLGGNAVTSNGGDDIFLLKLGP